MRKTGDKWKKGMIGLVIGVLGLLLAVLARSCALYFNQRKEKQGIYEKMDVLIHTFFES